MLLETGRRIDANLDALMQPNNVDFPEPDRPNKPLTEPSVRSMLTSMRIGSPEAVLTLKCSVLIPTISLPRRRLDGDSCVDEGLFL